MLVAKLPGSMYATAATKAGPRKGSSARRPRVWPLRAFSAARSTRSSPGSATATGSGVALTGGRTSGDGGADFGGGASTAKLARSCDEHAPRQPQGDDDSAAFDAHLDRTLVLAHSHDLEAGSWQQASTLELAQAARVLVGNALHEDLLARVALAQWTLAQGAHLAACGGDGVAMRIELWAAEQFEDALLHPLRHDVLEAFGLVVNLIPVVAEHLHQEHLEEAMVPHQLEGDLPALAGQLLASVAVVLDQALGG